MKYLILKVHSTSAFERTFRKLKNRIVFVIALFLCLWLAIGLRAAEEPRPKIEIVTKDADIGEMQKGKILDFKVEVKNTGNQDLIIENVYSSCGCFEVTDSRWLSSRLGLRPSSNNIGVAERSSAQYSSSEVEKKPEPVIVKPGKSIFIATRLDTNKVTGQFEKQLHIISNDPAVKDAAWRIKGTVLDLNNIGVAERSSASDAGAKLAKARFATPSAGSDAKIVMLFYLPGCDECKEIREKFLTGMQEKYKDKMILVEYNIDNPESFAFMIDLQNKYDQRAKKGFFNPKPPAIFIEKRFLYGVKEIEENLEKCLTFTHEIVK